MKKKLVVLSGAGMSAESGIKTFRDSDGLWEEYNVMDVASIEGWFRDPQLIIEFYNKRRLQLGNCLPNNGHKLLAEMETQFDVEIITQNVDNLHERAGSTKVLHLHGELTKVKSCNDDSLVTDIGYTEIKMGDFATDGAQLRPDIVWFGEAVPMIDKAIEIVRKAEIFVVIGTSLTVYPASGLLNYIKPNIPLYIIDPSDVKSSTQAIHIKQNATEGVKALQKLLRL
jgi:NAD-dependent deacetylase